MYSKMLSLRFPKQIVNEPIVVNLVRDFDLTFNILKATVYPRKEGKIESFDQVYHYWLSNHLFWKP